MTMFTLQQVVDAVAGDSDPAQRNIAIDAVSSDSRRINAGELFVALKGENFDGHDYVAEVIDRGAGAALVSRAYAQQHPHPRLVAVTDPLLAMAALAKYWRKQFRMPLIGVVGSNGKTTTKGMCAAILTAHFGEKNILATTGNLNNEIGLPTMVLRLHAQVQAAVLEIGMNHPGETAVLAEVALPTVALINNAQREHQEFMKTVHAVAVEHAALIDVLASDGIAVINADDDYADLWREHAGRRQVLSAGLDHPADVSAKFRAAGLGGYLQLSTPWGGTDIKLAVSGIHNARNAAMAAAATLAIGVPLDAVARGLENFAAVKGRLQQRRGREGATLIDDSYNANPDSVRAAIEVLASIPGKRILVIGDMGEVGEQAAQYHDEVGGYAKSQGIDLLFCLGQHSRAAAANFGEGAAHFEQLAALIKAAKAELDLHTTVLIKGSRFMQMERVADALADEIK
jgi:UDP-N-acetylmuramoyl-tripeptide--D-alanyl-D-alanine ligase